MHKTIVTLLLALVGGSVTAEWVQADKHQVGTKYLDPTAIERTSNTAKALVLIDFKAVQGPPLDAPFRSSILQNEYDCGTRQVRGFSYTNFAGPMAGGEIVQVNRKASVPSEWYSAVSPSGKMDQVWEFVCKK